MLGRRGLALLLLVLGLSSFGYLFFLETRKVLSSSINSWREDHFADCGIVLTGGAGRVREGLDLLARGSIKKLIISGVYPGAQLRDIFPEWPYYGSLKDEDVILEKHSRTTFGNAQQTQPLVEALRCQDIVLITSSLHMYRASRIFKSIFHNEMEIYPRAVMGGQLRPSFFDTVLEALKSLFYSLWAY